MSAVWQSYLRVPFYIDDSNLPMISVVVCSYNGSATIKQCMEGLMKLNYPNYEVIVINDGSTDHTAAIVSQFDVTLISTENKGLSSARNLGMKMANGEIVAYIDDDAYPDPDWLYYLGRMFVTTDFAAIGGPNISPPSPGFIADCVDHTPGAPTHVLLSDTEAEHIPGCNMAFRRTCLEKIGGFDIQFRAAGDDVDVCWKIQDAGWRIGYCAAALVWHHRRGTVKGFWKQQKGYGKAEALLERKWPDKYNSFGHRTWGGRIYGNGHISERIFHNWRIYHGIWGMAPFQSLYGPPAGNLLSATLMPEWYLISLALLASSGLGYFWSPMIVLAIPAFLAVIFPLLLIFQKIRSLKPVNDAFKHGLARVRFQFATMVLHMLQPLARLWGRLSFDLTPWRRFGAPKIYRPYPHVVSVWCENWISPELRLTHLVGNLRNQNLPILWGNDYDRWDFGVKGGVFGLVRLTMAAEDHAGGKQYLRFRLAPALTLRSKYLLAFLAAISVIAMQDKAWTALGITGLFALWLSARILIDCSIASAKCIRTIKGSD
ncbi:MAG: glycosyltransferase [Thermoanaerobaculia bacterium]|nr:glycosyltransferase [Thermoanaerobaculia bacterium]